MAHSCSTEVHEGVPPIQGGSRHLQAPAPPPPPSAGGAAADAAREYLLELNSKLHRAASPGCSKLRLPRSTCGQCQQVFRSREALFQHIKSEGHAQLFVRPRDAIRYEDPKMESAALELVHWLTDVTDAAAARDLPPPPTIVTTLISSWCARHPYYVCPCLALTYALMKDYQQHIAQFVSQS
jgi:uncharacterized C2H2 Zn-finger protein